MNLMINKSISCLTKPSTIFLVMALCIIGCKGIEEKKETVREIEAIPGWSAVETIDGSKPIARHEAAFVRVKDKFYLLGGRGIRPVSIFDSSTKKWTEGTPPPLEMHHFQPIVYKDKVYIFGAMTGKYPGETPIANIIVYDPLSDSWSTGDEIPENRRRGASGNVVDGSKVYLSCGILDGHRGDHKTWLDSYDFETGKWEILKDAPSARDHFQAALVNGKIYNIAGRLSNAPDNVFNLTISQIDVYDIERNEWRTIAAKLPTERAGNMVTVKGNEIWVVGGESGNQERAHDQVEIFNTTTEKWTSNPTLMQGRHGTGILDFNGALYIASGCGNRGGNPELETMEKFAY